MSVVRTFWHLPEDELEFLDAFERLGPTLAVPWVDPKACAPRALLVPLPLKRLIEVQDPGRLLILPVAWVEHLVRNQGAHPDGREWHCISAEESCVIAYERVRLDPERRRLAASHLSAWWKERERQDDPADKPIEFINWARHMFRWIRRNTPGRVSRRAAKAKSHGLELIGF